MSLFEQNDNNSVGVFLISKQFLRVLRNISYSFSFSHSFVELPVLCLLECELLKILFPISDKKYINKRDDFSKLFQLQIKFVHCYKLSKFGFKYLSIYH